MSSLKDVTVCLYTSTKGHFGRHDIFKRTVESLLSQVPVDRWGFLLASIKVDKESEGELPAMDLWLRQHGFATSVAHGEWSHFSSSHQTGYLQDQIRLQCFVKTHYILHLEDDWQIGVFNQDLAFWLTKGIELLDDDPFAMQVRIARFSNEPERIADLKFRHGINGHCIKINENLYRSNDWSNNPYLARSRDIRAALTIISHNSSSNHSEHDIGNKMWHLGWNKLPFCFLSPQDVRSAHLGTEIGKEDSLEKENICEILSNTKGNILEQNYNQFFIDNPPKTFNSSSLGHFSLDKIKSLYKSSIFIETGSGKGNGIRYAQNFDFDHIYSVEIFEPLAKELAELFYNDKRIQIINSSSQRALEQILPLISDPIIFFLDAHFPGADVGARGFGEEPDEKLRMPLFTELDIIKNLRRKSGHKDVIIIDDFMFYDDDHQYPGDVWKKQLDITPRNHRNCYQQILDFLSETHTSHVFYQENGYVLFLPK